MNIFRDSQAEPPLQGIKYPDLLGSLLTDLHSSGTERDRAGHRKLFYDPYALLLPLYFFNPAITRLRGLQRITDLNKVRHLGIPHVARFIERSAASV